MTTDDYSVTPPPGTVGRFAQRFTGLLGLAVVVVATWIGYKARFEMTTVVIEISNMQIAWATVQAQWFGAIGLFLIGSMLVVGASH